MPHEKHTTMLHRNSIQTLRGFVRSFGNEAKRNKGNPMTSAATPRIEDAVIYFGKPFVPDLG